MNRYVLSLVTSFLIPLFSFADTYPKDPRIDIQNYAFNIHLSDTSDAIYCEATIDVKFMMEGITTLRLDLVNNSATLGNKGMIITSVHLNGKPLVFKHENNNLYITLDAPTNKNQRSKYVISYHGIPASGLHIANNKYGDRTFFSDNWPDKGRNWLPMIDHPYDKATCEFIVTAPAHYQVVSNGLKIEETDLQNGTRLTHWKQSVPIASWLYVLGVARFAVQYVDQFDGKSIETWVYHQDRDAGFYDFAEPTKKVLEFYSDRIGPFVYEKLANIQSNSVSGGMEAASAILYSQSSVVGDRNDRWRNVVIHEIAHQWWGNSVTEYDWDDVWLSEGFATYFTLLFIEHQYGHDEFLKGLASSKKSVDAFYEKNPGYCIVHKNLDDMSKVTSSQTYQKGSWTLHMLRGMLGDEIFWKGIRSYYATLMNGSASTAGFRYFMEQASGKSLRGFFYQWLYKPGTLKVKGDWQYNAAKKELTIQLDQVQEDGSLFTMPIQVGIQYPGKASTTIKTITLEEKSNTYTITVDVTPSAVILDPDSWVLMNAEFGKKK
ncbi:MAG: M1 family peptidase [Chitinophagales bacterium]|nr:M1 family peptidase [Chitinophagales bacterium]